MPVVHQSQRLPATSPAFSRTLLLGTDLQQSILIELDRNDPSHAAYTAYGSQSGTPGVATHLGFNGMLKERSVNWYHLGNGHRMFNPVLMRFHSSDRLSPFDKGGMNAYAYCEGDPVNFTDPTGQFILEIRGLFATIENLAGNLENFATALFRSRSRPGGVLGYASAMSNVGYAGIAAGTGMQMTGLSAGVVVSNVGAVLASAGNVVKAAHGAAQVLKGSRFGRAFTRRMAIKRAPPEALVEVVAVSPNNSSRSRVHLTPSRNLQAETQNVRRV